jgi:hypothetical protein
MKVETLTMRLDESMGELLTTIAREHIQYNLDVKKGLSALVDSGIPEDFAKKIILGKAMLKVKDNMFAVLEIEDEPFDIAKIVHDLVDSIHDDYENYIKYANRKIEKFLRRRETVTVLLPASVKEEFVETGEVSKLAEYVSNNLDGIEDEYGMDESILETVKVYRRFIERVKKAIEFIADVSKVFSWFSKEYRERFDGYPSTVLGQILDDLVCMSENDIEVSCDAVKRFDNGIGNLDKEKLSDTVESFIDSSIELERELEKPIHPVDLKKEIRVAGWISPEGDYYGLNGETANFLHIAIADKLREQGVIPTTDDEPDLWLEMAGWVRQHDNKIQFAGGLFKNSLAKITNAQKKALYEIGQRYFNGSLLLGFRFTPVSAVNIEAMDESMLLDYFV